MARGPRMMDQIELLRSLRRKRGGDPSMEQAACSLGGLFGFIFLLQWFDLATLAIFGVLGYIVYRYFTGDLPMEEDGQPRDEIEEKAAPKQPKSNIKTKQKARSKK
eukprot:TRINITY_DN11847_c0_g1_i1.p1 TRINITY_DN11847_c0_g1~~TRINITY_DN11847_c0_g1_i1.p1  ORF type:complete len:106 (-),score=32.69 TRINITY_DN11847_c0_g1_i1:294-611(-)